MELNLTDKVAVITGGGGAICGEIARSLVQEGALVAIWDISLDAARSKQEEIFMNFAKEENKWSDFAEEKIPNDNT